MSTKRWLVLVFLPLVLTAFLQSQSVVELAKKEKERREALKGKSATVVTNAELAKVKKKPSIDPAETAVVEGEAEAEAAGQAVREGATPPEKEEAAEQAVAAADVQVIPAEPAEPSPQELDAKQNELLEAASEKQEMVDLLALKMNALYQEFYGLDNQKSKELLQIQISDTYDKLLKAEADAAKARKEVEAFIADRKKASTPAIWIK
ncbi:MAG: hypothetical protein FJY79_06310 [Candidatus Aminicenantes bacterium]|nr:hypothetical protein [Candidatus Aminicenantes bacterium]